jgi:hypothetical protein
MEKREQKKDCKYLISITGSNTNFECPINTLADFDNLDEILKILKKKLQNL